MKPRSIRLIKNEQSYSPAATTMGAEKFCMTWNHKQKNIGILRKILSQKISFFDGF